MLSVIHTCIDVFKSIYSLPPQQSKRDCQPIYTTNNKKRKFTDDSQYSDSWKRQRTNQNTAKNYRQQSEMNQQQQPTSSPITNEVIKEFQSVQQQVKKERLYDGKLPSPRERNRIIRSSNAPPHQHDQQHIEKNEKNENLKRCINKKKDLKNMPSFLLRDKNMHETLHFLHHDKNVKSKNHDDENDHVVVSIDDNNDDEKVMKKNQVYFVESSRALKNLNQRRNERYLEEKLSLYRKGQFDEEPDMETIEKNESLSFSLMRNSGNNSEDVEMELNFQENMDDYVNEKLAWKLNSLNILRERVHLANLSRDVSMNRYAAQITSELITKITDELSEEMAREVMQEELPNHYLQKIVEEVIDELVHIDKEYLDLMPMDRETVESLLNKRGNHLIHEKYNIPVTGEKIRCLAPTEWLNDEVINFYFNMCKDRSLSKPGKYPQCHFFNTFFYSKLDMTNRGYTYSNVRTWTRKIDLFSMDKVIIPVHLGVHWVLSVINIRDKRFEYYDSMLSSTRTGKQVLANLQRYLQDEHQDKKKKPLDTSDWEMFIAPRTEYPQQANGWDCGMFTCKCANAVSQDLQIDFGQRNMQYFRHRMILEIKRGFVM